jgi:N-acetylglucosaminyl-diphospho-decaprenol L-rhamnosyltransferase
VLLVDVVVVSYNSRDALRHCVEPLAALSGVRVVVVDNASSDGSLETVADLPVHAVALPDNRGFAHGCNVGICAGRERFVLLLNPDATLDERSLRHLVQVLEDDERVGAVAPQIRHSDGSLEFSLRRFPRLRSSYSRALFLHRMFPRAHWSDEVVRNEEAYVRRWSPEWVSGACILLRRALVEDLGGLDERFFLYSEDTDLCRRVHDAGFEIRYEPTARATHAGGGSAPRAELLPVLAASRVRYAQKHCGRGVAVLERGAVGLESALRAAVSRGGRAARFGHVRTLASMLGFRRALP